MSCLLDVFSSAVFSWTSLEVVFHNCPRSEHILGTTHHLPTHTDAIVGIQDRKH